MENSYNAQNAGYGGTINPMYHQPDQYGRIDVYNLIDPNNSLGRNVGSHLTSHYMAAMPPSLPFMPIPDGGLQMVSTPNYQGYSQPVLNPPPGLPPTSKPGWGTPNSQSSGYSSDTVSSGSNGQQWKGSQVGQPSIPYVNTPMQLTTGPAYNGNPLYPQGLYTHAHFEAPNHSARPTSVTQHKSAASPRVRNPTPRQTDPTRRRTKPTQARTKPAPTSQQPEPRKSPEAPKSVKSVEPPEPPEPPKPVEPVEPVQPVPTTVPLPFGLDQLQAATQRLDAEAKQREELEKKLADTAANSQRQDFLWPGDTSAYPAEVFADVDFPESEFRARTIHMGNPKNDARPATGVYAVQKTLGGRIEYRIARDGCPVDWVDKAPEVQYGEISLNVFFAGMRQAQAEIWIRQMLATVPGRDDTLVKWHRAGPGPPQPEAKGRWAWVSE